jgi:hypothetical protein
MLYVARVVETLRTSCLKAKISGFAAGARTLATAARNVRLEIGRSIREAVRHLRKGQKRRGLAWVAVASSP